MFLGARHDIKKKRIFIIGPIYVNHTNYSIHSLRKIYVFNKNMAMRSECTRASFEQQKQHFNHKFILTVDYPLVCIWFGFVFEFTFAIVFYPVLFYFLNFAFLFDYILIFSFLFVKIEQKKYIFTKIFLKTNQTDKRK